jgi:hypothetical protein
MTDDLTQPELDAMMSGPCVTCGRTIAETDGATDARKRLPDVARARVHGDQPPHRGCEGAWVMSEQFLINMSPENRDMVIELWRHGKKATLYIPLGQETPITMVYCSSSTSPNDAADDIEDREIADGYGVLKLQEWLGLR